MRKFLIYVFTVLLPAVIVGVSNFTVFPDSSFVATAMLVITVGVAGVFTYFSGDAMPVIRRYCVIADIVICAVLCVNLGGHWILSREVSAAKQGVTERHAEEDRELEREKAKTELEIARKKADAELADKQAALQNAERRRLAQLPRSERRSSITVATPEPTTAPTIQPLSLLPTGAGATVAAAVPIAAPRLTPEQVRKSWWWFLTGLAIAECAASVLAGCVLAAVWQWDKNKDGIPDHLQRPIGAGAEPGK